MSEGAEPKGRASNQLPVAAYLFIVVVAVATFMSRADPAAPLSILEQSVKLIAFTAVMTAVTIVAIITKEKVRNHVQE